jgi:hypothetical protein
MNWQRGEKVVRISGDLGSRVLRGSGTVDTLNVTIEVGRKWFHLLHAGDQAASVQLNPPTGFRPQVTALVEDTTP